MAGRRRASIAREVQSAMGKLQQEAASVDWSKVFKASFMLLFVSYPGTVHTGREAGRQCRPCSFIIAPALLAACCGDSNSTGVSLKVMRMFKCRLIEGRYWLEADMRLECYTGQWAGYVTSTPTFTDCLTMVITHVVSLINRTSAWTGLRSTPCSLSLCTSSVFHSWCSSSCTAGDTSCLATLRTRL